MARAENFPVCLYAASNKKGICQATSWGVTYALRCSYVVVYHRACLPVVGVFPANFPHLRFSGDKSTQVSARTAARHLVTNVSGFS